MSPLPPASLSLSLSALSSTQHLSLSQHSYTLLPVRSTGHKRHNTTNSSWHNVAIASTILPLFLQTPQVGVTGWNQILYIMHPCLTEACYCLRRDGCKGTYGIQRTRPAKGEARVHPWPSWDDLLVRHCEEGSQQRHIFGYIIGSKEAL